MPSRVFAAKYCGVFHVYVSKEPNDWKPFKLREIRELYFECADLRELANRIDISPLLVRRMLTLAGIDFVRDLYNRYLAKRCCETLARQNGMKPATLSKLFKDNGLSVFRRHIRPVIPRKKLQKIWRRAATINGFARALGVHWQTAFAIHKDHSLPAPKHPPKRLGRPPGTLTTA